MALLRGINVGGVNVIRMEALRGCFHALDLAEVATYIQSGNVVFRASLRPATLRRRIESTLAATFGYEGRVVLRSHREMRRIVAGAPAGFGGDPSRYRYDVVYLREPVEASHAMPSVRTREGVDEAHAGEGVIYFSRLIARAGQSYLSRLVATPVYQDITIRNWNTTVKLLAMLGSMAAAVGKRPVLPLE